MFCVVFLWFGDSLIERKVIKLFFKNAGLFLKHVLISKESQLVYYVNRDSSNLLECNLILPKTSKQTTNYFN